METAILQPQLTAVREFAKSPEQLISTLFRREKVIVSILGEAEKPLLLNDIRRIYVGRVFANVAKTIKLHGLVLGIQHETTRLGRPQNRWRTAASETGIDHSRETTDFLSLYLQVDTAAKIRLLTAIYKILNAGRKVRKVPILPQPATLKKQLADLMSDYLRLVEVRPSQSTKPAYYLAGWFHTGWHAQRTVLETKLKESPFTKWSEDELVFYGLENELLDARIKAAGDLYGKFCVQPKELVKHAPTLKREGEAFLQCLPQPFMAHMVSTEEDHGYINMFSQSINSDNLLHAHLEELRAALKASR